MGNKNENKPANPMKSHLETKPTWRQPLGNQVTFLMTLIVEKFLSWYSSHTTVWNGIASDSICYCICYNFAKTNQLVVSSARTSWMYEHLKICLKLKLKPWTATAVHYQQYWSKPIIGLEVSFLMVSKYIINIFNKKRRKHFCFCYMMKSNKQAIYLW